MTARVLSLDPQSYQRHSIHRDARIWSETNCYVDIWIELLHALGHDPVAALPFTLAIDFEGDQWTFFKFPHGDLLDLFGLDVQELALWRPLTAHLEEQLERGHPVLVELDSWFLPDTAGTAYRSAHVKTTVAAVAIDVAQKRLGYFHGPAYFELQGEDFDNALRVGEQDPSVLPPYAEFVRIRKAPEGELRSRSSALLSRHLQLAPAANPFDAFRERLARDLESLLDASLDTFHQYSFATLRQLGACYELAATYLTWLGEQDEARPFLSISESAKAFQFQLARAMARRKPLDLSPLDAMGRAWSDGMTRLKARHG